MLLSLQNRFFNLIKNFDITYKRYLFKEIDFGEKLIGIIGARGVGKTTLLLQYLKYNSLPITKKLYVNAEFIEISALSLFKIAEEFEKKVANSL